jgi:predicted TIM-barrel enzyme
VNADTIRDYLPYRNGFIVGTSLKRDGNAQNPVDPLRVRELMAKVLTNHN